MSEESKICEWFDQNAVLINSNITKPELFTNFNVDNRFSDVLTDFKKCNNNYKFNLFNNVTNDDKCIISHKYQIHLSKNKPDDAPSQFDKMIGYMKECVFLYNFCVSIWNDYNDMTDNWIVLKNTIYDLLYRDSNGKTNLEETKRAIIQKLKNDKALFIQLNSVNEVENTRLHKEHNELFKEEMKTYKHLVNENKKLTVKLTLVKPKKKKFVPLKVLIPKDNDETRNHVSKPAPDDSLKWEIQEFCTNLKNGRQFKFEKQIDFVLKPKETDKTMCMLLSQRVFSKTGIYSQKMGKLNCENYKMIMDKYNIKDSRMCYDVILKKFYLMVVHEVEKITIPNRKEIVSIDEGEKTFLAFYSNKEIGKMGDNMRTYILSTKRKIVKMEKTLLTNKNKMNKTLKNKSKVRRNIRKAQIRIRNYVNNVHKKASLYLCENYENIFLPEFKTQQMVKKKGKNKLPKQTKIVLMAQSHYKFKIYLKNKALRYRTKIYDVDEAYTSQTCSECGKLSKTYDNNRVKTCPHCKYKIDRDVNGSKNILLKCITEMHKNTPQGVIVEPHH